MKTDGKNSQLFPNPRTRRFIENFYEVNKEEGSYKHFVERIEYFIKTKAYKQYKDDQKIYIKNSKLSVSSLGHKDKSKLISNKQCRSSPLKKIERLIITKRYNESFRKDIGPLSVERVRMHYHKIKRKYEKKKLVSNGMQTINQNYKMRRFSSLGRRIIIPSMDRIMSRKDLRIKGKIWINFNNIKI